MQRCLHINASSDEDYRSSRNIAISLFKRYRNVIDRGGADNLKVYHLPHILYAVCVLHFLMVD